MIVLGHFRITVGKDSVEREVFMTISTNRKVQRTRTIASDGSGFLDWGGDVVKVPTYDSSD